MKIFAEHTAEQFIAVDLTDKTSRIAMIRNIGRILGKDVSNDLIDGIIAFLKESGINFLQDQFVLSFLIVSDSEGHGLII